MCKPLENSKPRSSKWKRLSSCSTQKKYAPAVTLAAAAEGCLDWSPESPSDTDEDMPGTEPLLEVMIRGANEKFGKSKKEAIERFNALVYWLKHPMWQA